MCGSGSFAKASTMAAKPTRRSTPRAKLENTHGWIRPASGLQIIRRPVGLTEALMPQRGCLSVVVIGSRIIPFSMCHPRCVTLLPAT